MPNPRKNESKQDFLRRCTNDLVDKEGKKANQAFATCNANWEDANLGSESELRSSIPLSVPLELKAVEGADPPGDPDEEKRFYMVAYAGNEVDLGWMGRYIFDVKGMKAKAKLPALREHMRDRVAGQIDKWWKANNSFLGTGTFSETTQDGQEVHGLALEGYPWQVSVGIKPQKIKVLQSEKETEKVNERTVKGPIDIVLESEVGEISFVSIGADSETAVIALNEQIGTFKAEIIKTQGKGEQIMDPVTLKSLNPTPAEVAETLPDVAAHFKAEGAEAAEQGFITSGREMGRDDERTRVVEIMKAKADPEVTLKAIEDGTPSSEFYKLAYDHLVKSQDRDLRELADEVEDDVGTEIPKEPKPVDGKKPDVEVARLALEMSDKEKIPIDVATERVLEANPKLAEQYFGSFDA